LSSDGSDPSTTWKNFRYQENLVWQTKTTFGTSAITIFEIEIEITIFLESNPDQNRDFA